MQENYGGGKPYTTKSNQGKREDSMRILRSKQRKQKALSV
jgi:hypothetical protein